MLEIRLNSEHDRIRLVLQTKLLTSRRYLFKKKNVSMCEIKRKTIKETQNNGYIDFKGMDDRAKRYIRRTQI